MPWLQGEVRSVRPELLVCLGATAAKALLGSAFRVTRDRGKIVDTELGPPATGTAHPSAILRLDDSDERRLARAELVRDLGAAAREVLG